MTTKVEAARARLKAKYDSATAPPVPLEIAEKFARAYHDIAHLLAVADAARKFLETLGMDDGRHLRDLLDKKDE